MAIYNYQLVTLIVSSCLGAVLFGYDTGFIGPATSMQSFQDDFGVKKKDVADFSSLIVSCLQIGCFVGCVLTAFTGAKFGRRTSIAFWGVIFNIGAILQCASKNKKQLMYVGRVISGLGVGACSLLTPAYLNEMSPREIRGAVSMMYGVFLFLSICIAYWVDYACHRTLTGTNQWLVPVGLQLFFGTALTVGMIPLKESPRWLVTQGKEELALKNLKYIRKGTYDDEKVSEEFQEIVAGHQLELEEFEGRSWRELLNKSNLYRVYLTLGLTFLQQATGTLSFTYFSTTFFEYVGISGSNASLFATGIYGIVKFVVSLVWALFFIDKVGRKKTFRNGALIMGTCMFIIAGIYKGKNIDKQKVGAPIGPANYVMIVMIYIFCVGYAHSWGPVPYTYFSEIYPNRIRDYGVAMGSGSQWLFNYAFTRMIPYAIKNIGWKTFVMFGVFNYYAVFFSIVFLKETSGIQLEDMEKVFAHPWSDAKNILTFKKVDPVTTDNVSVRSIDSIDKADEKRDEDVQV